MPFLSHLRELRDRVRNAAIFFVARVRRLLLLRRGDLRRGSRRRSYNVVGRPNASSASRTIAFATLTEPFWVDMSVALWAGIFVASPFIFYQLWKFIAPGLYKRERRITVAFAVFSAVFFIGGALFCYYFVLERLYELPARLRDRGARSRCS